MRSRPSWGDGTGPLVDIEETLGALTDLVQQGKVRYIGSSVFPPSAIVEAQWAARERNLQRYICEQPPYSILARGIEAEVLPLCERYGMGVISWSPLSGGWLTGRWRKGTDDATPTSHARRRLVARYDLALPANQRKLEATEALVQLAEEAGLPLVQMALAFALNHPAITSVIIGPRTMEQLESQLPAADLVLDRTLLDRIDEIVTPGTNINAATAAGSAPHSSRLPVVAMEQWPMASGGSAPSPPRWQRRPAGDVWDRRQHGRQPAMRCDHSAIGGHRNGECRRR